MGMVAMETRGSQPQDQRQGNAEIEWEGVLASEMMQELCERTREDGST